MKLPQPSGRAVSPFPSGREESRIRKALEEYLSLPMTKTRPGKKALKVRKKSCSPVPILSSWSSVGQGRGRRRRIFLTSSARSLGSTGGFSACTMSPQRSLPALSSISGELPLPPATPWLATHCATPSLRISTRFLSPRRRTIWGSDRGTPRKS